METKINKKDNVAELEIELSKDEVRRYMRRAAKDLGRETAIKGFRKGAAPYEMLEAQIGKERIFQEALQMAVRESYVRALIENEIETVGQPEIQMKKAAPENPLVFTAKATLLPEVNLGNYEKIPLKKLEVDVPKEEIEKALTTLQRSRAKYTHVNRPAQKGDRVEIDFETKKGGVSIEGGISKQHPLILGEGHFMPGFEEEIIGIKEGGEKHFSLTVPQDYYHKQLAGQELDFTVKILNIQEVELPKIDDEFAKMLGKFGTVEELKQSITDGLKQEKEDRAKERQRLKIIEHIGEHSDIKVPKELIEGELTTMEREFDISLERMNIEQESYLSHLGKSMEELKKEWKDQAKKRVQAALILRAIGKEENVHVPDAEVDERVSAMLQSVSSPEQTKNIDMQALRDKAHASLRNEKVFELLEDRVVNK